jgi:hypothetical protein
MAAARKRAWTLALGAALLAAPARLPAQEIYQAVILDLTDLAVHVTVARARADDQLRRLLLRDTGGKVRQASSTPVSAGQASGSTTILIIPLALLDARETEFVVVLVRGGTEIHRTERRPIFGAR